MTPTFYAIGGGAIGIQDIKPSPNAPDGSDGINFVQFQQLDANSEVKEGKTFYWYNCTKTPKKGDPYDLKGWYETPVAGKTSELSALTINPGEAFYMKCPTENVTLTFSGEVKTNDLIVGINQGYTLVGNPFPKDLAITDLIPEGDNVPDGADGINFVQFQLLDKNSEVKEGKTFYWYNCTKTPKKGDPYDLKGWYDTPVAGKTSTTAELDIPAGCGLYMKCPAENVSIRFKGF